MGAHFAGFELVDLHGVPLLFRRDDRFKTFRVVLCAQRPLQGNQAARALLPALLVEGTRAHPDRLSLVRQMELLYGAHAVPGSGRFGESSVLRLAGEGVSGAFLPGAPDQWGGTVGLLAELLCEPRLQDGAFPAAVFLREQRQAADAARAVFDDKSAWARQRSRELACAGEPYGVPEHGGVEALAALTAKDPEAARRDFLSHGRLWAVAMGALPERFPDALLALLERLPSRSEQPVQPPMMRAPQAARRTTESAQMQQSKLVLTLRCGVPGNPAELCALHALVSLWGGGPHSRLFREVRERRSLAYQVGAGCDVHKGLVQVQAGLDVSAAEAAEAEILAQLAALQGSAFRDDELATAVASITGPLQATDDSLGARMQFTGEQWLRGFDQTLEQRLQSYAAVDRAAVVRVAGQIWLDHVYQLRQEADGRPQ